MGKLFRMKAVEVIGAADKTHSGIISEPDIIQVLVQGIVFLNHTDCNLKIKAAFLHFLIGYVHPFYDGNGRLARYLSLYILADDLQIVGLLGLSKAIRQNRKEYYRAFEQAKHQLNCAELTQFAEFFLRMVVQSMKYGLEVLNSSASADSIQ